LTQSVLSISYSLLNLSIFLFLSNYWLNLSVDLSYIHS